MRKITLSDYTIHIGDLEKSLIETLASLSFSSCFVLVDENTHGHCLPILNAIISHEYKLIKTTSGEGNKNINTCQRIWSELIQQGADRHSLMINLGGGVLGDMGGFCASTYMRGIRFIQIPTTLLSQVDSSVGSKLGVDLNKVKNIVGLFNNPVAVLIDPVFLNTLPFEELRSGYAEVIKHALIFDKEYWKSLLTINDLTKVSDWETIIYRSVKIKKEVVTQDPFEKGLRKILNFGHTIGHALESNFLDTENHLLHGEAVAWGMIYESELAQKMNLLSAEDYKELYNYLHNIYGDIKVSKIDTESIFDYMKKDKKNKNQEISFSLLNQIGNCLPAQTPSITLIREILSSI